MREQFLEILELQKSFTNTQSGPMDLRKKLIEEVRSELSSELGRRNGIEKINISASTGLGTNSFIPWIRFFDPVVSPSATRGWYIVLLFPMQGNSVYLSLNQGTNSTISGDLKRDPISMIEARKLRAREVLSANNRIPNGTKELIKLNAPKSGRGLAAGYEAGNVFSFEYELDQHVTSERIVNDVVEIWSCIEYIDTSQNYNSIGRSYETFEPNYEINDEKYPFFKNSEKLKKSAESHFNIQNELARLIIDKGHSPLSPENPPYFDIAWVDNGNLYFVEVKSLRSENEVEQIRYGLGQVLQYRQQLKELFPDLIIRPILACERKPESLKSWQMVCAEIGVDLIYGRKFEGLV